MCISLACSQKSKRGQRNTTVMGDVVSFGEVCRDFGQFSVPQIESPLAGISKKGSHVYFLLQVFWVILLFGYKCCSDATMVT